MKRVTMDEDMKVGVILMVKEQPKWLKNNLKNQA